MRPEDFFATVAAWFQVIVWIAIVLFFLWIGTNMLDAFGWFSSR